MKINIIKSIINKTLNEKNRSSREAIHIEFDKFNIIDINKIS